MDENRPGLGRVLAEVLIQTAAMLALVYSQLPPQERYWIKLQVTGRLRRLLDGLAVREGRAGMADELAGRDPVPRYSAAYRLALLRDRAARLLDGMRP